MPKAIKTQSVITSLSSKKDRSLGLRVETPELSSEEKIAFMDLQGVNVEMWIKPIDEDARDIVEVKNEVDSKTPSQRLRSVLFVLWDSEGRPGEFVDFYTRKMERIINTIKERLQ